MTHRTLLRLALITGVAFTLWLATAAGAATNIGYGNYSGPSYDFIDMNETVQSADDEPNALWEAPTGSGDNLLFSPSSFIADSANADGQAGLGAFDDTHSTFNTTIMSTGSGAVDMIMLDEGGDITLGAFPPGSGTAATGVIANMSGTVQIVEAVNPLDVGTIITFGGASADFPVFFNIGNGIDNTSLFKGLQPPGTFSWTAHVAIDIASIVPGATKVELQWNNQLQANSEAGTSSLIQKKAGATGISVIPEPGTAILVMTGLIGLSIRRAHGRRA